jgi:hypothetical protein
VGRAAAVAALAEQKGLELLIKALTGEMEAKAELVAAALDKLVQTVRVVAMEAMAATVSLPQLRVHP